MVKTLAAITTVVIPLLIALTEVVKIIVKINDIISEAA
jgi:hypothetical protein